MNVGRIYQQANRQFVATVRRDWKFLGLLIGGSYLVVNIDTGFMVRGEALAFTIEALGCLLGKFLSCYVLYRIIMISHAQHYGREPLSLNPFDGQRFFWFAFLTVVWLFAVLIGIVIFIVPGFIWMIGYGFAPYNALFGKGTEAKGLGALNESCRLTARKQISLIPVFLPHIILCVAGIVTGVLEEVYEFGDSVWWIPLEFLYTFLWLYGPVLLYFAFLELKERSGGSAEKEIKLGGNSAFPRKTPWSKGTLIFAILAVLSPIILGAILGFAMHIPSRYKQWWKSESARDLHRKACLYRGMCYSPVDWACLEKDSEEAQKFCEMQE